MDLLRAMASNRQAQGLNLPVSQTKTPPPDASEIAPGTRAMKKHIIAKKPKVKMVKKHMEALILRETESSSSESD